MDAGVSPQAAAWADAAQVAALLWVDPHGLGGVAVHAAAGPVRSAWLDRLTALQPAELPLRRMPVSIGDERLLGGLDLAATLAAGRPVAQRGLLGDCDGGLVIAAMAERMPAATAARIAGVLDRGEVLLERDGLATRGAGRIGVVALDESASDDEALPAALADRLAFRLDLDPLSTRDVVPGGFGPADVRRARELLPRVEVGDALLEAVCAAAQAFGVDAPRAALFALRTARALAALRGQLRADADDASAAVRLVIGPRATRLPAPPPDDEAEPPPPPPDVPDSPPPPDADDEQAEQTEPQTLEDQLIEAARAALPAGLLAQLQAGLARRSRSATAGRVGALKASKLRGRPIGARRGEPRAGARLDLLATLRAAAPWQRLRGAAVGRVAVRSEDFHIRRFQQRNATTTVFAIDASGSSALHRLAEAKGAVELLLADCYVRRDEVAVIAFRGAGAELLLPPTRSLVRAKRSLAGLPGGGGTPLASGIGAATVLADQLRRAGNTPVVVLLTDGRANIARDGTPGRARAGSDAQQAARVLRASGVATLVVDTSAQSDPAARQLAQEAGATYLALPHAQAQTLSQAVRALPLPGRG